MHVNPHLPRHYTMWSAQSQLLCCARYCQVLWIDKSRATKNHSLNAQTDDEASDMPFSVQSLNEKLFPLPANLLTQCYPLHGVRVSFLLSGRFGPYQEHYTSRRSPSARVH